VLCAGLGAKMPWEARDDAEKEDEQGDVDDPFAVKVLLTLAVATTIDALAAGLPLPLLGAELGVALSTLGVTTAALSAAGLFLGRRFGARLGQRLDVVGDSS